MSGERPNVVCIVADDLGWRDLGCYGSAFYETPNLDRLAQESTRWYNAYAASPVCSPSRASILTGLYPARTGITDWIDSGGTVHPARGALIDAPYASSLSTDLETLPTALRRRGYTTWHVGKWHLGGEAHGSLPADHGFDVNIGGCEWGAPRGAGGYFRPWDIPTLQDAHAGGFEYLPDALGHAAASLISEHAREQPFFLHYAPYLVHTPLEAPDDVVERYRAKRHALGLDTVSEFEAGGHFPTEHKRSRRIRRRVVQSDPVYAAMVEALDRNVGRVLAMLEHTDRLDETLIVFTSDNGGLATAEGSPTTNRPLRDGKGWMYEGGNRVPLLVRWPGDTDNNERAQSVSHPVIGPDICATILDATGTRPPTQQALDGESLLPVIEDPTHQPDRDAIYWHYPHYGNQGGSPAAAIRTTEWKLIEWFETERCALFRVDADPGEHENRIHEYPDVAARLRDQLHAWQREVGAAFPAKNPTFEPWPGRAIPRGTVIGR